MTEDRIDRRTDEIPAATVGAMESLAEQPEIRARVAVRVRDLAKTYPKPDGGTLNAVDGISFEVERGEIFGFLGPNGAGKTTTLEIIEGIRKPTSGEVRVLGVDPRRDLEKVKEIIGVQLQAASYFSLLTIEEILELFGSFHPRRRSARELLETVGLTDKRQAYMRQLSGGQQRRFSVAAALVNDPEVIVLDEPTTGLDPQMRHNLWELVRHLNREEGKTIALGLAQALFVFGERSPAMGLWLTWFGVMMLALAVAAMLSRPLIGTVLVLAGLHALLAAPFQLGASRGFEIASGVVDFTIFVYAIYGGLALVLEDVRQRPVLPVPRRGGARQALEGDLPEQLSRTEHEAGVRQQL